MQINKHCAKGMIPSGLCSFGNGDRPAEIQGIFFWGEVFKARIHFF
ncbi:MAG: hypothetical protein V8S89_06995 [Oscillospiraceae bacterium]